MRSRLASISAQNSARVTRWGLSDLIPRSFLPKRNTALTAPAIAVQPSPEMARAVKLLAVERGVTVQALIGEALDHVLRQAGKHPMGER